MASAGIDGEIADSEALVGAANRASVPPSAALMRRSVREVPIQTERAGPVVTAIHGLSVRAVGRLIDRMRWSVRGSTSITPGRVREAP